MRPGEPIGKHAWELKLKDFNKKYSQVRDVETCVYDASTKWPLQKQICVFVINAGASFFIKLSLFFLYLRIFKPDKVTRGFIYGGILVNGLFYSIAIVIYSVFFAPSPDQSDNEKSWMLRAKKNRDSLTIISLTYNVFSVLSDIYLLVLPIRFTFHLQLPMRKKFEVSSVFLIGILWVMNSYSGLAALDHLNLALLGAP